MLQPSRLLKYGMALLLISVIRVVAFPIAEPVDRESPGLWFDLYSYSVLIWIPAVIMIALSAIIPVWRGIIRWAESGR